MASFGGSWMLPAYLRQTSNDLLRKEGEDKPDQAGGSVWGVTPRILEYLSLPLGEGGSVAEASRALSLSPDNLNSGTGRDYLFNTHTGARRWL